MTLQTGKDAMVTHSLSTVYGSYCITQDGAPMMVTADTAFLFQSLEGLSYGDAARVRVILLSSEEWAQDDITAFVWEAMAEAYAGTTLPDDWDHWREVIGDRPNGFIQFGYDEFNPNQERAKRKAEDAKRAARAAKFRQPKPDAVCVRRVA